MSPKAEFVVAVTAPMPEIGAEAGDEIVVRIHHPDFPIVLRRTLPLSALRMIVDGPVKLLSAEVYDVDSERAAPPQRADTHPLRRVGLVK